MLGAIGELSDVELSAVEAAVGSRSFKRGRGYAGGKRVVAVEWDPSAETLTGSVVGHGALYSTAAFFAADREGVLAFDDGECTCPVGYNCKHVAAIVIAAVDNRGAGRTGRDRRLPRQVVSKAQPRSWEKPLRALIEAPATQMAGNPLAIELGLRAEGFSGRGAPRLMARLMRPGARGGWVNGSLTWSGLDSCHIHSGEHRPDHMALVRELYAVHRAREGRAGYCYGYSGEKTLDLSDDGPQLWSLLDEAARLGLPLVHARRGFGEVPRYQRGELLIDVTRQGEQGSLVRAVLRVDGDDADGLEPVLFLGSGGHGVLCAERADVAAGDGPESWRLRLVRLAKPAAPQLQRMVLDGERLEIPASELPRFADELCPALRNVATVVSSDGSFTPPEISAPKLVLRASYGADHAVEVGWEWAYQVGATVRRAALDGNGAGPGFRDLDAERAILAGTVRTGTGLERFGLLDGAGRPAHAPPVALTGLETMRFTTEELPRIALLPDVAVEVAGQPADYRDVGDSLTIGVSTADVVGERDWFDLGVTVSVDGRELRFAEVFTALASGESHVLLADGTHFSLLSPRLQSLRQLIEEARGLADSPSAPLRISRYQAALWAELAALGVVTEQAEAWQRQVGALLEIDAIAEHEPPPTLAAQLRPYQLDGFGWLASLWGLELGGILADDMGLGKTLQTLALICHARERDPGVGPFLVIAPTSVVSNWVGEAARFAAELEVSAVTDTLARSGRTIDEIARADVVVTTYTLFRLEADVYSTVAWAGLILDEAQYVKNHQANVPLRPRAGRAVQAGDHGHADGEQPAGAVVTAVDHSARALSRSQAVCRAVRAADRTRGRWRAARAPAAQDQAARQAPHEGAGGRRPPGKAGAGPRGRPASAASQALRHLPAA